MKTANPLRPDEIERIKFLDSLGYSQIQIIKAVKRDRLKVKEILRPGEMVRKVAEGFFDIDEFAKTVAL